MEDENTLPPVSREIAHSIARSLEGNRNPLDIGFTIYSVSEINPVEQTFNADIKVKVRWHDTTLEADPDMISLRSNSTMAGVLMRKLDNGKFPDVVVKVVDPALAGTFRPRYEFANAKSTEPSEDDMMYLSPNDPPGWVRWEKRFNVTFNQQFDVQEFPFDLQKLQIIIRLPDRMDRGRLFREWESPDTGKLQEMKSWVKLSEWTRYETISKCEVDSKRRGKFVIEIPLERKPEYYVKNVMAVMVCICLSSFAAFAIDSTDLASRLSVVFTMLLTAVAFKIVIADALPKVGYSTVLDIHLDGLFAFMMFVTIENVVSSSLHRFEYMPEDYNDTYLDFMIGLGFIVAFVVFHVCFLVRVMVAKRAKQHQLEGLMRASDAEALYKEKEKKKALAEYGYAPLPKS